MYSESVLNSSYVYNIIKTSKEVLAGLKIKLTFLPRATSLPSFIFFQIKVTPQYSSYFCLKYFAIFVIRPQIYVKLCLTTEIALFLQKMWKNDGNTLEI